MEILFENRYTRNREWAKEYWTYNYFFAPFSLIVNSLLAFLFVIGVFCTLTADFSILWAIFMPIFWYALIVFLCNRNTKLTVQRDMEMFGKTIDVTVTVTNDNIKVSNTVGSEAHLNYNDVKKAIIAKNYIFLLSKTNTAYTFRKNSFTVGNTEQFLNFLAYKGIKLG